MRHACTTPTVQAAKAWGDDVQLGGAACYTPLEAVIYDNGFWIRADR